MTERKLTVEDFAFKDGALIRVGMTVRARYRLRKCDCLVDRGGMAGQFARECFLVTRHLGKCLAVMAGLARGAAGGVEPDLRDAGA